MNIEKLMMAKAIMDKTSNLDSKGIGSKQSQSRLQVENFDVPNARYNIPQDMISENPILQQPVSSKFMNQGYPEASVSAIQKSKLPDAIKRLMIEHPIEKPAGSSNVTLSDDLIERATRLMGTNRPVVNEQIVQIPKQKSQPQNSESLKRMMKQVVQEVLKENGMLLESVEKSNDNFRFQVGNHIFEGKVTKIKKLS